MTADTVLRAWHTEISTLAIVNTGERNSTARENMLAFSIADAQDAGVDAAQLTAFVRDTHRAYSLAAAKVGLHGWFYAWHDEQAGQLRMSAAPIASASELPFGRNVMVVDDPSIIATDALANEYAHGIPFSELSDASEAGDLADNAPEPSLEPLRVYARPLVRSVQD